MSENSENLKHEHDFFVDHKRGETRTVKVIILTAVMMTVEIAAGLVYGSMALLADGWHMGTHVAAFCITVFAYRYARKHAKSKRFSFGAGKVSVLGGFASAVALASVAMMMILESVQRMFMPHEIRFDEAIMVAVLGMIVNLVCAYILHEHDPAHHAHEDHNLKAAYFHILADVLTSVLAITALITGKYLGWNWMDPCMGIVGACVITVWAIGLLRETSVILLDNTADEDLKTQIKELVEQNGSNEITDLHVWKVGPHHFAAIVSLYTENPRSPDYYKTRLKSLNQLSHITIEVNHELLEIKQ